MRFASGAFRTSGFKLRSVRLAIGDAGMLMRGVSSRGEHKKNKCGVLCCDYTFSRVFGTTGVSEDVLVDLLGALRFAATGTAPDALRVKILNTKARDRVLPTSQGQLLIEVHASDDESSYIVDLQRRREVLFHHQALLHALADIDTYLKPTHVLAFCDEDLGASINTKRHDATSVPVVIDSSKTFQAFKLQSDRAVMDQMEINEHLEAAMKARVSIVFAFLQHAPLLQDITSSTSPLLRWTSIVAHLQLSSIDTLSKDVRDIKGVQKLLEILDGSRSETEQEQLRFEQDRKAS